jgi:hypothetical protein
MPVHAWPLVHCTMQLLPVQSGVLLDVEDEDIATVVDDDGGVTDVVDGDVDGNEVAVPETDIAAPVAFDVEFDVEGFATEAGADDATPASYADQSNEVPPHAGSASAATPAKQRARIDATIAQRTQLASTVRVGLARVPRRVR